MSNLEEIALNEVDSTQNVQEETSEIILQENEQIGIGGNPAIAQVNFAEKRPEDPFSSQELYFLAYPKLSYQIFLCRECRNRQFNCIGDLVKKTDGNGKQEIHRTINISLCPYCIHANLRIYHTYKSL